MQATTVHCVRMATTTGGRHLSRTTRSCVRRRVVLANVVVEEVGSFPKASLQGSPAQAGVVTQAVQWMAKLIPVMAVALAHTPIATEMHGGVSTWNVSQLCERSVFGIVGIAVGTG